MEYAFVCVDGEWIPEREMRRLGFERVGPRMTGETASADLER